MLRFIRNLALPILLLGASFVYAADAIVVDEGAGYKQVILPVDALAEIFSSASSGAPSNIAEAEFIIIDTLGGLYESNAPEWWKLDVLNEEGYASWSEVSSTDFDAVIRKRVLDLNALNQLVDAIENSPEFAEYVAVNGWFTDLRDAITRPARDLVDSVVDAGKDILNAACPPKWDDKKFNKSYSLGGEKNKTTTKNGQDYTGTADATINLNGTLSFATTIKLKERCSTPYEAEFDQATFKLASTGNYGQVGVKGRLHKELSTTIIDGSIPILKGEYDFWVWIIYAELIYDLKLDYGITASVDVAADIEATSDFYGDANIEALCTSKGCNVTKKEIDFEFDDLTTHAGVTVKAQVTPYADLNVRFSLELYKKVIEELGLAEVKAGIVAALPVTYYGYWGNTCSDVNFDGVNETLNSQLIDVSAELSAYINYRVLSKEFEDDIEFTIPGFKPFKSKKLSHQIDEEGKARYALVKSIYFKDFGKSSPSMFDPQLAFNSVAATSLSLRPRSCMPLTSEFTYEVEWGNGLSNYVGNGLNVVIPSSASTILKARIKEDSHGREFTAPFISVPRSVVNVSQRIKHSSGKCLTVLSGTDKLVFSSDCTSPESSFTYFENGLFMHNSTGYCVHPRGGSEQPDWGTELVIDSACQVKNAIKFEAGSSKSIKQTSSGLCVHPNGGSPWPSDGTTAVLWNGCDETRLEFDIDTTRMTKLAHNGGRCVTGKTDAWYDAPLAVMGQCDNTDEPGLTLLSTGQLFDHATGQCVHPQGGSENPGVGNGLVLYPSCAPKNAILFEQTGGGSLRHKSSGMCIHPNGGSGSPSIGTQLVLWTGCDEERLGFKFIYP